MRFIHLSGLRLGEGAFDERFQIDYRAEREQAFRSVLDAAREGEIEAVFLTGDVMDHAPNEEELWEMDELFLTLPKTRFFWLTGEKDRVLPGDALGNYEWKSNTQVFSGDCIRSILSCRNRFLFSAIRICSYRSICSFQYSSFNKALSASGFSSFISRMIRGIQPSLYSAQHGRSLYSRSS